MDNNVLSVSHSTGLTTPAKGLDIACSPPADAHAHTFSQASVIEEGLEATVPANVRLLIRGLIERYGLTREQLLAVYNEYERMSRVAGAEIAPGREGERREEVEEPMNIGGDAEEEIHCKTEGGGDGESDEQQLQGENGVSSSLAAWFGWEGPAWR